MICNDFWVVKVNCPSYVFNISKSILILRNIKNKEILEKAPAGDDVIPGKQTREQAIGVLSETLHYTTVVTSEMSTFLKHKLVKYITSYLISVTHNNANMTSVSWYDVTNDGNSQRITIPKRPINLYFLAFYGIIYQNSLHRRVYIAVSS